MARARAEELDSIRRAAAFAMECCYGIADELDDIISSSLPSNSSRALRAHLRQLGRRMRDSGDLLAHELDDVDADRETLSLMIRLAKRAGAVFLASSLFAAGAMATGAMEGLGNDIKDNLVAHVGELVHAHDPSQATPRTAVSQSGGQSPRVINQLPTALRDIVSQLLLGLDDLSRTALERYVQAISDPTGAELQQAAGFVLSIEPLAREAFLEYADDPAAFLAQPGRSYPASVRQATLLELLLGLQALGSSGSLPAPLAEVVRGMKMPAIVDLRNQLAHGRVMERADYFSGPEGLAIVGEAILLWQALRSA